MQAWIRDDVRRHPAGTWIWTPRVFPTRLRERRFPTRKELDDAAPAHPVVVDGAYGFALNSTALRLAGIGRDTPDPTGGAIVKDDAGEPTGLLRNVDSVLASSVRRRAPFQSTCWNGCIGSIWQLGSPA